jgi:glucose/arabinose dehydrogenase
MSASLTHVLPGPRRIVPWIVAPTLFVGLLACSGESASVDAGSEPEGGPVGHDGGTSDAGVDRLSFHFEEIALEGEPMAITEIRFLPGSSDFLLAEKTGRVTHYRLEGDQAVRLGTFDVPEVDDFHDCGLIAIAFDPDFTSNKFVYFGHCIDPDWSRISRLVFDPDAYDGIADTAQEIIRVGMDDAPNAWHNIGSIGFDEQGRLWALVGDKNERLEAQDPSNPLGGVIRINPVREPDEGGYEAVAENPFFSVTGYDPNLVAYGLRSPWRGHFDDRGNLWVGDVGGIEEEVNVLQAFDGSNFGWPVQDGPCEHAECEAFREPLIRYDREPDHPFLLEDLDTAATSRRAIWVGLVYRDNDLDRYDGRFTDKLVYGDFCAGWVRATAIDDQGQLVYEAMAGNLQGVTSWDQALDGYAYVSTYGTCRTGPYQPGKVYRAVLAQ